VNGTLEPLQATWSFYVPVSETLHFAYAVYLWILCDLQ